jgi:hypothetical protein
MPNIPNHGGERKKNGKIVFSRHSEGSHFEVFDLIFNFPENSPSPY